MATVSYNCHKRANLPSFTVNSEVQQRALGGCRTSTLCVRGRMRFRRLFAASNFQSFPTSLTAAVNLLLSRGPVSRDSDAPRGRWPAQAPRPRSRVALSLRSPRDPLGTPVAVGEHGEVLPAPPRRTAPHLCNPPVAQVFLRRLLSTGFGGRM